LMVNRFRYLFNRVVEYLFRFPSAPRRDGKGTALATYAWGRRGNAVFAAHILGVRIHLLLAALALSASSLSVPVLGAPALRAFSGWQPGQWQSSGGSGQAPVSVCLRRPDALLLGGRPDSSCRFSTIQDAANAAAVTYQCTEGRQGRTDLRRDTADLYTVDAQGLDGGRPFAGRTEWQRVGSC